MVMSGKQCCRPIRMFGAALFFAAVAVQAAPLAERVAHPGNEKVAKSKPVRFIEKRPQANPKAHGEMKEAELPLPVSEKLPVREPQPLELKGVRG